MNRILPALALILGLAGCTSMPGGTARAPEPRTYAIVVTDTHGLLSQNDLQRVEIGIVQYLLDQGYVRHDQSYVRDVMHADIVFRVQIAWQNAAAGSFTVAEIVPTYGAGQPAGTYVAEVVPDYSEPWLYGDYYGDYFGGYAYGPWSPFLGVVPFAPVWGSGHIHRPWPPLAHRGPDDDKKGIHRDRPPGGYAHWDPRWGPHHAPGDGDSDDHAPPSWQQNHPPRPSINPPHHDWDHRGPDNGSDRSGWRNRPGDRMPPSPATIAPPRPEAVGVRSYPTRGGDSGYRPAPRQEYSSGRGGSEPARSYSPPPSQSYSSPAPAASAPAPAPAQSHDAGRDDRKADR